jgi:GT2 family glycosyltransferase
MKILQKSIPMAIRSVDISRPLVTIGDLSGYPACRIFVFLGQRLLGKVDITNTRQLISPARLRDAITDQLNLKLASLFLNDDDDKPEQNLIDKGVTALTTTTRQLPASVSVSIVLATYDRPDQLKQSLQSLHGQDSPRNIEIVVVDNHPSSGLTPPVVAQFPGVVLVSEIRHGLAYALNAGFTQCRGEIVVTTYDDVIIPSNWVDRLVAPFERSDVAAVTGNVLPCELETEPQLLFEEHGGLGQGFDGIDAGIIRLRTSQCKTALTWRLGSMANAAFRAEVFHDPRIGLMDEALGPGMPSGDGEDTYLFYKIIKAGFTLVYEPDAYVWHTHLRDHKALRRQIYNYSKGHVSYHLTTLFRDGDRRAIIRLLYELPCSYLMRSLSCLRGRSDYPFSLILLEIRGNLAGPFALWRSRRRVRREGRSEFPASSDHHVSHAE